MKYQHFQNIKKIKKIYYYRSLCSKPNYGAGSDNVRILRSYEDIKRDKNYILSKILFRNKRKLFNVM